MSSEAEITIKAVLLKRGQPEYFPIKVTEDKYFIVKKRLDLERNKIVNILKRMEKDGLIQSIFMPSNKKIQKELDALIKAKQVIRKSMQQITAFFT